MRPEPQSSGASLARLVIAMSRAPFLENRLWVVQASPCSLPQGASWSVFWGEALPDGHYASVDRRSVLYRRRPHPTNAPGPEGVTRTARGPEARACIVFSKSAGGLPGHYFCRARSLTPHGTGSGLYTLRTGAWQA